MTRPDQPRLPELRTARDPRRRQRRLIEGAGGPGHGRVLGRRAGRRGGRHPVRGPGPHASHARPNPKYFGRRKGSHLAQHDQRPGASEPRAWCCPVRRGTRCTWSTCSTAATAAGSPEVLITDTGSYSDMVFGLLQTARRGLPAGAGRPARPEAVADQPDRRLRPAGRRRPRAASTWTGCAGTGRTSCAWSRSVHTGEVVRPRRDADAAARRQPDPARRGPRPLRADLQDPARAGLRRRRRTAGRSRACATCRRTATAWPGTSSTAAAANCTEPYHAGMEDQLGALGLVLNCITLWNTVYLDARPRPAAR